ncbi:MAG: hypothetical protein JWM21_3675 [Acidobacteria bacterium]|nr:hypothetical protein [Acidobacteriota bacterium]
MPCLTLGELLTLEAIMVPLIAYVGSIIMPEFRRRLGLEPPSEYSPVAEKVVWAIWIFLVCLAVAFIVWFLLCLVRPRETIAPGALLTPQASPTPIGPIKVSSPVEVDGGEFTLYVFSPEYHWRYGKVEAQFNQKAITEDRMISYLKQLNGTMALADAVICVGTASKDIEDDEPGEESRALLRAQQLATWLGPAISLTQKNLDVYELNLGHYREQPDTASQRLILLVSVKKVDPNISLQDLLSTGNSERLKRRLKEKNFPFSFDSYSLFELHKKT